MLENERKYAIMVGAMKSGTSAIFSLLRQHPQVCPSLIKEPRFFVKEDYNSTRIDEYQLLWNCKAKAQIKFYLEASTSYTKLPRFPNAAERIKESGITAKFIYVMRHPLERIISQLNMSLAKNWDTYDENNMVHHSIINISRYYFQIKEYYNRFEKEDILLLCFEDFTTDPTKTMDSICQFLGLSRDFKFDYNKVRRHEGVLYTYNNKRILLYTKLILGRIKRKMYNYPRLKKIVGLFEKIFDRVFGRSRVNLSLEDRTRITNILLEDLKDLHDHYGFDISKWELNNEIKQQK